VRWLQCVDDRSRPDSSVSSTCRARRSITAGSGPKLPTSSGDSGATAIEGATDTLEKQQMLGAIALRRRGADARTGSVSRGHDRFAGMVSCGGRGSVIFGQEAENVISRLGGLRRRADDGAVVLAQHLGQSAAAHNVKERRTCVLTRGISGRSPPHYFS
jgi:hypothetical protein